MYNPLIISENNSVTKVSFNQEMKIRPKQKIL